jgi:hypothetical protein
MPRSTVLVATWEDGLFVVADGITRQELAGQAVGALASDGQGGALAIVDGKSVCRRTIDGDWRPKTTSELELACCIAADDAIYVGTNDARVLRLEEGRFSELESFLQVAGRDRWYAGSAVVDGRVVGPPLGVRTLARTCDGGALLANVHVGGIPRSTDGGVTWHPTIDIDADVHQVCAHPRRPDLVIAAAAAGLCISRDAGRTWTIETEGLHARYCSAVAFAGDDLLVAASTDHFARQGAVYRRSLHDSGPLVRVGGGLPAWLDGIADTANLATRGSAIAVADRGGNLYVSEDDGATWSVRARELPGPSAVLLC